MLTLSFIEWQRFQRVTHEMKSIIKLMRLTVQIKMEFCRKNSWVLNNNNKVLRKPIYLLNVIAAFVFIMISPCNQTSGTAFLTVSNNIVLRHYPCNFFSWKIPHFDTKELYKAKFYNILFLYIKGCATYNSKQFDNFFSYYLFSWNIRFCKQTIFVKKINLTL